MSDNDRALMDTMDWVARLERRVEQLEKENEALAWAQAFVLVEHFDEDLHMPGTNLGDSATAFTELAAAFSPRVELIFDSESVVADCLGTVVADCVEVDGSDVLDA